jgi:hypothetical protein
MDSAKHDTEMPSAVAGSNVISFSFFRSKQAQDKSRLGGATSGLTPAGSYLSKTASSSQ